MRRVAIGLVCTVLGTWGCSSNDPAALTPGTMGGASGIAGGTGATAGSANADAGVEYKTIVNIVDAKATAQIESLLSTPGTTGDYTLATQDFLELYPDEYDFIYLILDHTIASNTSASFAVANRPVIAGTGLERPALGLGYPSRGRLKGAAGFQYSPTGMPPFAHETLHYWANHLDPTLGFGKDHDRDYGTHWGPVSVYGQLGGFDGATLKCAQPAGATPPACQAESNGRYRYTTSAFAPNTNSFNGVVYAPLELYMMGLVSQSEVPASFALFQDASMVSADLVTNTAVVEAAGVGQIAMSDIVSRHGVRVTAAEAERHFTAAFVVVSAAPASQTVLDRVVKWQEIFGNHQAASGSWISFEAHTGGRATLETRIGRRRTSADPPLAPPIPDTCSVSAQDCGRLSVGCYDFEKPACVESKGFVAGAACEYINDCAPGNTCMPNYTDGSLHCAPYCDPNNNSSPIACSKLCPNGYSEDYAADLTVIGASCYP